jgi:hypothetical protein
LGKLSASIQAVFPAPLHYQSLLKAKNLALKQNQSYETLLSLDQAAIQELIWWRDHLSAWNGKSLLKKPDSLIIETDASNLGWGATCNGIRTGGAVVSPRATVPHKLPRADGWRLRNKVFLQKQSLHPSKTANGQYNCNSLCKQNGGSIPSPRKPCVRNLAVVPTETDSSFCPTYSRRAQCRSGRRVQGRQGHVRLETKSGPFEVDLFATRLTNQLPRFVSWRPDPEAEATDAFTQNWSLIKGYAFPPFNLVGRCLAQMRDQKVEWLCIATPIWETQPWYPLLLEMSGDYPQLLPAHPGLLTKGEEQHPLSHLQLAGWLVSANPIRQWEFQSKLKPYYCRLGENKHQVPMTLPGGNGVAGVINNKLIHFMPLSNM